MPPAPDIAALAQQYGLHVALLIVAVVVLWRSQGALARAHVVALESRVVWLEQALASRDAELASLREGFAALASKVRAHRVKLSSRSRT